MWKMVSGGKGKLKKGRQQVIKKFSFKTFSNDFVSGIE
jgi:hypothetical protein